MIPKIIHQTWKNKDIPPEWQDAVDSCKKINKGYKYILWTDKSMDDFVKKYYPSFYKIYKSYEHNIQRCDAFRYLVLYKYGGIYLDMDIKCNKNLNKFLHFDLVLAHDINFNTSNFMNSFFMVIPNHPFFKYCIEKLPEYKDNFKYFGKHLHVMNSTGPSFLTIMVKEYGKIKNLYVLSKQEFTGDCNICNENTCNGGIYFTHIQGNSWHDFDSTIYNFVFCNKNWIALGLVLGIGVVNIKKGKMIWKYINDKINKIS
jgi:mannosyltransferase OCH1-like enzyme